MDARLDLFTNPVLTKFIKHLNSAARVAMSVGIPPSTLELMELRISQINGCAVCVDMHSKDLAHHGETAVRINLVATWREATVYTEAERAALALAEAGTRIADAAGGVPDDVWLNATKHYNEEQLGALVAVVAGINTWNRLNVITQQPAGDYVPGQWG
ncbi:AhpD family alkylhydroperoxidase [Kribbella sp. VKM Ac-2571]|uniref:carboxymuconolactone decarboxylase family protein n=1 Tax=Kribbella sp. VKM Ac-2571 TaxID=2512222 RepID=UPI00105F57B2|nr:carboxymuconolactone decarboxylase family protein [Kribbella sp. VKM Ac-2571]TDO55349.1 AhpD family alkylhydroperoxidase [Kribbella sp. VKM Ac-2571]